MDVLQGTARGRSPQQAPCELRPEGKAAGRAAVGGEGTSEQNES